MPRPVFAPQEFVPLAPLTTLGIGGPARFLAEAGTEDEVAEAVQFARERGLPLFVLGGGSNLLVSDAGFDGLVLRVQVAAAQEERRDGEFVLVEAGAGEEWDGFVRRMIDRGYAGVECLAGIPGDVGGTPVQNVGAYGQEVAETIEQVRAFDLTERRFVDLNRSACGFGYRRSIFNTEARRRYVVTSVTYRLRPEGEPALRYADVQQYFSAQIAAGKKPTLREVYDGVRAIRESKGMLVRQGGADGRSAGSFFKNPVISAQGLARVAEGAGCGVDEVPRYPAGEGTVKLPAAWLVERAGFHKGFVLGRAAISSKHTLALVNLGGASAKDLLELRDTVMAGVERRFGIALEQEPVMLGFGQALGREN